MWARSGNVSGAAAKAPRALARSSASVTIWASVARRDGRSPPSAKNTFTMPSNSAVRGAAGCSSQPARAARPSSVMVYSRLRRLPVNRSVATAYPCSASCFGSSYSLRSARGQNQLRLRCTCLASS